MAAEDGNNDSYSLHGTFSEPESVEPTACPKCATEMTAESVLCIACGFNLTTQRYTVIEPLAPPVQSMLERLLDLKANRSAAAAAIRASEEIVGYVVFVIPITVVVLSALAGGIGYLVGTVVAKNSPDVTPGSYAGIATGLGIAGSLTLSILTGIGLLQERGRKRGLADMASRESADMNVRLANFVELRKEPTTDPQVCTFLLKCLASKKRKIRMASAKTLTEINPEGWKAATDDQIRSFVHEIHNAFVGDLLLEEITKRKWMMTALKHMTSNEAESVLQTLMQHGDPRIQQLAREQPSQEHESEQ